METEMEVTFPLNLEILEHLPRNTRKTKIVRFSKTLDESQSVVLLHDLCHPSMKRTPTATTKPDESQVTAKNDLEVLRSVIEGESEKEEHPTETYHIQEIGLLVATALNSKTNLLSLAKDGKNEIISKKAIALSIHSGKCVTNEDLRSLFAEMEERDKKKFLRACARDVCREELSTELIRTWLVESSDRKLVACEVLHAVKVGTPWLIEEVRKIMERGQINVEVNNSPHDVKCFGALRFDLLWKRHGKALVEMIHRDLVLANHSFLRHAQVFSFYAPLMSVKNWRIPGKNVILPATLANMAKHVHWEKLFSLYLAFFPFRPDSVDVNQCWVNKCLGIQGSPVSDAVEKQVSVLEAVTEFTSEYEKCLELVIPNWFLDEHMMRACSGPLLLRAYADLQPRNNPTPARFSKLASKLLHSVVGSLSKFKKLSDEMFSMIRDQLVEVLKLVTVPIFYFGQQPLECYGNEEEYFLVGKILQTQNQYLDTFVRNLFQSSGVSTGQQLELLLVIHAYRTEQLKLSSQTLLSPFQLNPMTPNRITALIQKYERFSFPFDQLLLKDVGRKIHHQRIRNKSEEKLNGIFAQVVKLGTLDIQIEIDSLYQALSVRFPVVFGVPSTNVYISSEVQPALFALSNEQTKAFEVHGDAPLSMVNRLFLTQVMPTAWEQTMTEKWFVDLGPHHMFAKHEVNRHDVQVLARAKESMEDLRLQWFKRMLLVERGFTQGSLSSEAVNQLLNFLEKWTELSIQAVDAAADAVMDSANRKGKPNNHPQQVPCAKKSLQEISAFVNRMFTCRIDMYNEGLWDSSRSKDHDANAGLLLQRLLKLWARCTLQREDRDVLISSSRLDPYNLEPLMRRICKLPVTATAFEPFASVLNALFSLRLMGKIQVAPNVLVDAPARCFASSRQLPFQNCLALFQDLFLLNSHEVPDSLLQISHLVLSHLEKEKSVAGFSDFFKALEGGLDIRLAWVRKRLETDLTKPVFADRDMCMKTLWLSSVRSKSLVEIGISLNRIANAIENEVKENRLSALNSTLSVFSQYVIGLLLPTRQGGNEASKMGDRQYALHLHQPPAAKDWPSLLEAGKRISSSVLKLLDNLIESTEEKSEGDFRIFRTVSDELIKHALTWPCSVLLNGDVEISQLQRLYFDLAVEIQYRIVCNRNGKSLAVSTFRVLMGNSTLNAIRQFVLEAGFQVDVEYPTLNDSQAEAAFANQAKERRRNRACFVFDLFESAYRTRIGPLWSLGSPLMRKPQMETKRVLDLVHMIQGEWIHVDALALRIQDVVEQVAWEKTTTNHHNQVLEIAMALCEASCTWGIKCESSRPLWARRPNTVSKVSLRAQKRITNVWGLPKKPKKGRAEPVEAEDPVWCMVHHFVHLPPIIARFWHLAVEAFGIHHPSGITKGRCLLRMHIKYSLFHKRSIRAEQQTRRANCALALLQLCPSAIHLRLVQRVLRDFRQDLLQDNLFAFAPDDAILGKFSTLSNREEDEDEDDEDDDQMMVLDHTHVVRPFRLFGFYGFEQLTFQQGRKLALLLQNDVENMDLGTKERIQAVRKLSFLPCVNHEDFAQVLANHYQYKHAYLSAIKLKRKNKMEVLPDQLPLPESVVEELFSAILTSPQPTSLLSLLSPKMMQKCSSKTSVRVAERMRVLLSPDKILGVIEVLLSRRGKEGLLVGPLKALLRILFFFALESKEVVGEGVIRLAQNLLLADVWQRKQLHPDARIVLVTNAMKALGKENQMVDVEFAWQMLEMVATNPEFPNKLRALLTCALPTSVNELNSPVLPTLLNYKHEVTKEFCAFINELNHYGQFLVPIARESRFLRKVLLPARETCLSLYESARALEPQVAHDKQKLAQTRALAKHSINVRALLTVDLASWAGGRKEDSLLVFSALEEGMMSMLDNQETTYDNQSREFIYFKIVPEQLAQLANGMFNSKQHWAYYDADLVQSRIQSLCSTLFFQLLTVKLDSSRLRLRIAKRLSNLVARLSKVGSNRNQRLYFLAFAKPFAKEIQQLREENVVSNLLVPLLPEPDGL